MRVMCATMLSIVLEDHLMSVLLYRLSRFPGGRVLAGMLGLLLLLAPLAGCVGPSAPLQFTTLNIGLPPEALNSPVVGPLPDNTQMRIGVTFKVSQSVLDHFDQQKIESGKRSNLENFANQIGIS